MNALDLMNLDTVCAAPDTPLRDVARALLTHRMSSIPVVDPAGALVGIVSEGDLVGRRKTERETRSEWWLQRLAEGESLNSGFLDHLQGPLAVAGDVMSSPVLTVTEDTPADAIADIMAVHKVKRVPVIRDGRIVGIVRRADILRSMSGGRFTPVAMPQPTIEGAAVEAVPDSDAAFVEPPPAEAEETAAGFQHLVECHKQALARERARHRQEDRMHEKQEAQRLIGTHISDAEWHRLIEQAREAAARGESEFQLLRFPGLLCSDGGRAINAPDPEWPRTLRGEAAEVYLRWERDLRPRGFHLAARVIDFPGGIPGDIGLFLTWAE